MEQEVKLIHLTGSPTSFNTEYTSVYSTFHEITGEQFPSIADVVRIVSRYDFRDILFVVALINNTVLDNRYTKNEQFQKTIEGYYLSDDLKEAVAKFAKAKGKYPIMFHRQQQLLLLKIALFSCPEDGGQTWGEEGAHDFGRACLMINDLFGSRDEDRKPPSTLIDLAASLVPTIELPSDNFLLGNIGRALEIWINIPKEEAIVANKYYYDFSHHFEEAYKVSLEQFVYYTSLIAMVLEAFSPAKEDPSRYLRIDSSTLTTGTAVPESDIRRVLEVLSKTVGDFRDALLSEPTQSFRHDLTMFRRYPMIQVNDTLFQCFDRGFLRRMLTDGIYYLLLDAMPDDKKNDFQGTFGLIFQVYIERMLSHIFSEGSIATRSGNIVYFSPEFAGTGKRSNAGGNFHDEVCDVLIDSQKESLIIIETKASMLPSRAKYSGQGDILKRDFDLRFVGKVRADGSASREKGVRQLGRSIKRLLDGHQVTNVDIDISKFNNIYPVLISYDTVAANPPLTTYLETELVNYLADVPIKPTVRPLTVLTPNDLETFSTISEMHQLKHLLAEYNRHKHVFLPFGAFLRNNYRTDTMNKSSWITQRFDTVTESLFTMLGFERPKRT